MQGYSIQFYCFRLLCIQTDCPSYALGGMWLLDSLWNTGFKLANIMCLCWGCKYSQTHVSFETEYLTLRLARWAIAKQLRDTKVNSDTPMGSRLVLNGKACHTPWMIQRLRKDKLACQFLLPVSCCIWKKNGLMDGMLLIATNVRFSGNFYPS